MRITAVDSVIVPQAGRSYVYVLVRTDAGLTGLGEATLMGRERSVREALRDFAELVIGEDPLRREYLWHRVFLSDRRRSGAVQMGALAGIDVALWDIAGQALGLPIHRLLGGPVRDRVALYSHCQVHSAEEVPDAFGPLLDAGWTAAKFLPLMASDEQERGMDVPAALRRAQRIVGAAREFVGEEFHLLIETHGRLRPDEFIDLARRLEPFDPYFLEEPTRPEAVAPLRRIRRTVNVPLATGERLLHRWDAQPVIDEELVDYLQPDIAHAGGLTEVWKMGVAADAHLIKLAPHNPQSPVNTMASLHLDFALHNAAIQEVLWPPAPEVEALFESDLTIADGHALPPAKPGWASCWTRPRRGRWRPPARRRRPTSCATPTARRQSSEVPAQEAPGVYDDLDLPAGTRRPYTAIQMVMTLDGAIKGPTDAYWPIGGQADQRTFRRFRAHFDAVLHGARTLGMGLDRYLWSDELRGMRQRLGFTWPPLFVIVTNSAEIDPADRVFRYRRYPLKPIVVTHEAADVDPRLAQVAEIVRLGATAVDLPALAAYLTSERGRAAPGV